MADNWCRTSDFPAKILLEIPFFVSSIGRCSLSTILEKSSALGLPVQTDRRFVMHRCRIWDGKQREFANFNLHRVRAKCTFLCKQTQSHQKTATMAIGYKS
jgi:putative AlgH/UPF0301 family transcriptional regulator